jgi:squalene-hopene/tetraprenyl-beta-curcumene cyclase
MIDDTLEQQRMRAATPHPLQREHPGGIEDTLERRIEAATQALLACQRPDGHWVFELEADATIPAEYVLLRHYLGEPVDAALEAKIAVYLRRIQGTHGGWPLFRDGDLDVSATVKAYFALKMIGDSVDADHMRRAREAVRARGGAACANVFTRIMLALFGFVPWQAVPVMPVEIMLLPKWFPFHLDKISYWSRTVIVPLLVLMASITSCAQLNPIFPDARAGAPSIVLSPGSASASTARTGSARSSRRWPTAS